MTAGSTDRGGRPEERFGRAALSFLADPGDLVLGALLRSAGPAEILAAVRDGSSQLEAAQAMPSQAIVRKAVERWRNKVPELPPPGWLTAWEAAGYRLVCPGEPEWPT